MTLWLLALFVTFVYAALLEYCVHRWVMHYPGLGKGKIWHDHAVMHHVEERNDVNIALNALTVLLGCAPLFYFCLALGWPWAVFLLLAVILYAALWSALHASFHDVSECWLERLPVYEAWHLHHMGHHSSPATNFGTIFIWTDKLFGTAN